MTDCRCPCSTFGNLDGSPHDAEARHPNPKACEHAEYPAAAPEGTRLVLVSEDLFEALGASRVEWGEPDEHGRYTPTLYTVPHE